MSEGDGHDDDGYEGEGSHGHDDDGHDDHGHDHGTDGHAHDHGTDGHAHDHGTDGHAHDHDTETAADPRPRVRAVQSLLIERGLVSTDAIDAAISAYEHDVGPLNGARVVARAWTDPAYKRRLLEDATAAVQEFEFDAGVDHLAVRENTEEVHNAVVCTLCSCYPWSTLGLPPTWYKTPAYRSRMVREPRAVLAEFGVELPADVRVDVWDSSSEIRYMVLPRRPEWTDGYDEDELVEVVTRDSMIGVDRLVGPDTDDRRPAADGGLPGSGGGQTEPEHAGGGRTSGTDGPPTSPAEMPIDRGDRPTFAAPWQARAFGLVVALHDGGAGFDWSTFQRRLIAAIGDGGVDGGGIVDAGDDRATGADGRPCPGADGIERGYYASWLSALESLLVDDGVLGERAIRRRAGEFAAGDRTAAEFVEGHRDH